MLYIYPLFLETFLFVSNLLLTKQWVKQNDTALEITIRMVFTIMKFYWLLFIIHIEFKAIMNMHYILLGQIYNI